MNNNYYRFNLNVNDRDIIIPVELSFDNEGRDMGVEEYEADVVKKAINGIDDFETTKFAHAPWDLNQDKTEIYYQFNFFDPTAPTDLITTPPTPTNWLDDYQYATFTDSEIYYFANSFKGSFFKLDFYDKKDSQTQQLFLTVILPTQQGLKENGFIGSPNNPITVMVNKPKFKLDYIGANKEGFFVYFLKDKSIFNLDAFYVSCKFFNAKNGQFVRMLTTPQSTFVGPGVFNVNKDDTFYYKYILDYNTFKYAVYKESPNGSLSRVGTTISPIKWYEYVNP